MQMIFLPIRYLDITVCVTSRDERIHHSLYLFNQLVASSEWVGLKPELGGEKLEVVILSLKLIWVEQKLLYLLFVRKLLTERPQS